MGLQIRVSNLAGPLCVIKASPESTLRDLKEEIALETGIAPTAQILTHGTKVLWADSDIAKALSAEGVCLTLVQCTAEQMHWQQKAEKDRSWLKYGAPEEARADRHVVLAAVAKDHVALKYACQELRGDRNFILAAVGCNHRALQYASKAVRADRDLAFAVVAEDGEALEHVSKVLRGDREFVLAAVAKRGFDLRFASKALRADREVVLAAVARNGMALMYASEELRGDREVVLVAVAQNRPALTLPPSSLARMGNWTTRSSSRQCGTTAWP